MNVSGTQTMHVKEGKVHYRSWRYKAISFYSKFNGKCVQWKNFKVERLLNVLSIISIFKLRKNDNQFTSRNKEFDSNFFSFKNKISDNFWLRWQLFINHRQNMMFLNTQYPKLLKLFLNAYVFRFTWNHELKHVKISSIICTSSTFTNEVGTWTS